MSLGLALSGGGAKGAAHIGVLKAFEDEGINIEYISGTSSGSIIAGLYACGYSPTDLIKFFNMYCNGIGDYDKMIGFKVLSTAFTGKIGIKGVPNTWNIVVYSAIIKASVARHITTGKTPSHISNTFLNPSVKNFFIS